MNRSTLVHLLGAAALLTACSRPGLLETMPGEVLGVEVRYERDGLESAPPHIRAFVEESGGEYTAVSGTLDLGEDGGGLITAYRIDGTDVSSVPAPPTYGGWVVIELGGKEVRKSPPEGTIEVGYGYFAGDTAYAIWTNSEGTAADFFRQLP